jgi:hypothetical protein
MANNSSTGALYASFMQEIKERLDAIGSLLRIIGHKPDAPFAIYQAELAYLQIRFVCELIALASLGAHHSYGLNKNLLKAWRADEIFEHLEQINQHCFPIPVRATRDQDGITCFTHAPERGMSRLELKTMYGQCGNILHRGVLKHALAGKQRIYDLDQVARWQRKIVNLLAEHTILFPQEHRAVMVNLKGDDKGRVIVAHAEADGPFVVSSNGQ